MLTHYPYICCADIYIYFKIIFKKRFSGKLPNLALAADSLG